MQKLKVLIFVLAALAACRSEKQTAVSDTVPVVTIDVEAIESKAVTRLSEIFEPLEAIRLETIKESLIGEIDKVEFHGGNIYVFDSSGAKAVLVFSADGKYKYKIGRQGNGPGEYLQPSDFDVNDTVVRILDYKKLLIYDLQGNLKRSVKLDFIARLITDISSDYDAYYGGSTEDRIIVADKEGKIEYSDFEYSPKNRISTPFAVEKIDSVVLFSIPHHNTILKVTPDGVEDYCHIDLGKAEFTENDFMQLQEAQKMNVYEYVYNSDRYAFKAFYNETEKHKIVCVLFRKKAYGCIESKNTDQQLFFNLLSPNDDVWYSRVYAMPTKILDREKLVFIQQYPFELLQGLKQLENKSRTEGITEYEQGRLQWLKTTCEGLDEQSNPVILLAKIKDSAFE